MCIIIIIIIFLACGTLKVHVTYIYSTSHYAFLGENVYSSNCADDYDDQGDRLYFDGDCNENIEHDTFLEELGSDSAGSGDDENEEYDIEHNCK